MSLRLGLAGDYIAQLHGSCSPDSPPSLRAAIDQACRHLSGPVDDLQPMPVSAPGVHTLETLGQQNGAAVPDAAVGLAAVMPNTPEDEARILRLTACYGAAKPQNTVQAGTSAAKLWKVNAAWPPLLFFGALEALKAMSLTHTRPCRCTVSRRRTFSMWLVHEAVQQNGARPLVEQCRVRGHPTAVSMLRSCLALPNIGLVCAATIIYATSRKSAESNTHRATLPQMYPAPLEIQAVMDLVCAHGKEMQAANLAAHVAAQVGRGLVRASYAHRMMACPGPACC